MTRYVPARRAAALPSPLFRGRCLRPGLTPHFTPSPPRPLPRSPQGGYDERLPLWLCVGFADGVPFAEGRRFSTLRESAFHDYVWPACAPAGPAQGVRRRAFPDDAVAMVADILTGDLEVPIFSNLSLTNANAQIPTDLRCDAELSLSAPITRTKKIWLAVYLSATLPDSVYTEASISALLRAAKRVLSDSERHGRAVAADDEH